MLWIHFWRWIAPEWGSPNLLASLAFYLPLVASLVLQQWALTFTRGWPDAKLYRAYLEGCVHSFQLIAGTVLLIQSSEWLLLIIKDRQLYRQPVAHLLHALLKALRVSGENVSPLNRTVMFEQLEDAARCLESIARRIATGDPASNLWNELAYKRRATYIRELKKWILLPKIDTPQYIEHRLRELLDLVASNNWDGLPEADPGPSLPWWRIALSIARSLSIALVPLLGVYIFQVNHWLPVEFSTNILLAAGAWAIYGFLSMFDPRFVEKLPDALNFLKK
jgi:hypothetical protein